MSLFLLALVVWFGWAFVAIGVAILFFQIRGWLASRRQRREVRRALREIERAYELPVVRHPLERQPWSPSARSRWS